MANFRNCRGHYTAVRRLLRPDWRQQLHSLGVKNESSINLYTLNQRLMTLAEEGPSERKKLQRLLSYFEVLKNLADMDVELNNYLYIVRQLCLLKRAIKLQSESLSVAKEDLNIIQVKLIEMEVPPTRALLLLQTELVLEENVCDELKKCVSGLQKHMEQIEYLYGMEGSDQGSFMDIPDSVNFDSISGTNPGEQESHPTSRGHHRRLTHWLRRIFGGCISSREDYERLPT